ncbi:MAG: flagellar biosynthesis anti-sigma factor FlgM [Helicobacter sp.]|nr:flagellar biosynthesis anti-sigma factor FlgM [Helicobacter sp.]
MVTNINGKLSQAYVTQKSQKTQHSVIENEKTQDKKEAKTSKVETIKKLVANNQYSLDLHKTADAMARNLLNI